MVAAQRKKVQNDACEQLRSQVLTQHWGRVKEVFMEEVTPGRSQRTSDTYQVECEGNSTAGRGNSMCEGTEGRESVAGVAQTQVCGLGSGKR